MSPRGEVCPAEDFFPDPVFAFDSTQVSYYKHCSQFPEMGAVVHVEIPPEMIQKYIERRKTDLENLEQSLMAGNLEQIKTIAHQIKGNALSFGFPDLNEIVIEMEKAALSNNQAALVLTVQNFKNWVSLTRQAV